MSKELLTTCIMYSPILLSASDNKTACDNRQLLQAVDLSVIALTHANTK